MIWLHWNLFLRGGGFLVEPTVRYYNIIRQFIVAVMRRFAENRCSDNAAALTYTTLFAVVPVMTVTYSMLSAIPSMQGVSDNIQDFIFSNFVPSTGEVIQSYLQNFSQQARKLTVVGVAFLVVTSFMMLKTIDKSLNQIWQVHKVRRGVNGFLLYWAILSLGPLFLGGGFLLTSYLASIKLVSDTTAMFGGEQWLLKVMPLLLSTLIFTLLYSAVPSRKVPVRHALAGAFFAAILVELAKGGFALFITLSPSYQLIYGAFAAVPLFLLWIYITWQIVLLGAVIVRSIGLFGVDNKGVQLPPLISLLVLLKEFHQNFINGKGLTFISLQQRPISGFRLSLQDWEQHINRLSRLGIISKNELGENVLQQDLRHTHLSDLCDQLPWPLPTEKQLNELGDSSQDVWLNELIDKLRAVDKHRNDVLKHSLDEILTA